MLHKVFVIIFVSILYHGVRLDFGNKIFFENFTVIRTHSYIAFQEAYQEDFEYSDFFRDQASHCLGDVRREFICCGLDSGLEKQFKSKSATTNTRTQSFEPRYENSEHC